MKPALLACFISLSMVHGQGTSPLIKPDGPAKSASRGSRAASELDEQLLSLLPVISPDIKAFKALLAKGADPNAYDHWGHSVLLDAVLRADTRGKGGPLNEEETAAWLDVARLLLDSGANPSLPANGRLISGFTPLMAATAHDLPKAVELLLQYKADVNSQESVGATALSYAARDNNLVLLKLLVDAGADPNTKGDSKPLHWAARNGNREAVTFLLDCKANINARDSKNQTALGLTQELLKRYLADNGPNDPNIPRLKEVTELLRQRGAKE